MYVYFYYIWNSLVADSKKMFQINGQVDMGKLQGIIQYIKKKINRPKTNNINVYFISGMCYNCRVFDKLVLPTGYKKINIEWLDPQMNESLDEYTCKMIKHIDTKSPFILVGYSFGAVIIQEMNKYISPQKNIIISSFKSKEEIPALFRFAKMTHIVEKTPWLVYSSTDFITNIFNKFVGIPTSEVKEYMTCVDPIYIKWSATQIINWMPPENCSNLYHIQGTADQIFSFKQMKNVYPISGGDHLMLLKKPDEVSKVLKIILMKKE